MLPDDEANKQPRDIRVKLVAGPGSSHVPISIRRIHALGNIYKNQI